jgi:hypothetical protein
MNALDSNPAMTRRRSVSLLDRINAGVLLAITPEYGAVKRARGKGYGKAPTFPRPASMPLQHKTISGVKVRYAHAPRQDCPTVVLMNPLPQSIVAFAPLWNELSSHFNLYAYDLPGFGGSEGGLEYMTFEAQGRFLHDFIAEFGIEALISLDRTWECLQRWRMSRTFPITWQVS